MFHSICENTVCVCSSIKLTGQCYHDGAVMVCTTSHVHCKWTTIVVVKYISVIVDIMVLCCELHSNIIIQ